MSDHLSDPPLAVGDMSPHLAALVDSLEAVPYEGPTREECQTCDGTGLHPAYGSPNCPQPECPTCEGRRR